MVGSGTASTHVSARLRAQRAGALLLAVGLLLGGCGKGLAGALAPDFSGIWDVTYDDALEVEVQLSPDQSVRDTLGEYGGQLAISDAGLSTELAIDCARQDLVCPAEVWPRELILKAAPGRLDAEGQQLAQSLVGSGKGRCAALAGSLITGEVMTVGIATSVRPDAVALTSGRVRLVVDGACFLPASELPAGTRVVLTAGYTAAKR